VIEKAVTAYICEFCGKKQFAKGSMRRHEKRCTANHGRECKMCDQVEITGLATNLVGLSRMVEILSNREAAPKDRMEAIRAETDCPACTLAAIRQSGVWAEYINLGPNDDGVNAAWIFGRDASPISGLFLGFDFKAEKDAILKTAREVERENMPHCY
jgi:hypothetical protein